MVMGTNGEEAIGQHRLSEATDIPRDIGTIHRAVTIGRPDAGTAALVAIPLTAKTAIQEFITGMVSPRITAIAEGAGIKVDMDTMAVKSKTSTKNLRYIHLNRVTDSGKSI